MDTFDLSGKEPEALQALFNAAKQVGFGFLAGRAKTPLTLAEAKEVLSASGYVDYLRGRPLKVHLSPERSGAVSLRLYDRDQGDGAGERALRDAGLIQ